MFPATRPSFQCFLARMMSEVRMHIWGKMMTKREEPEFLAMITSYVLEMLASEDDHALDMVPYPYVDMD